MRRFLLKVSLLGNEIVSTIPDWAALDALQRLGAVRLWPHALTSAYRDQPDHRTPTQDDYRLLCPIIRHDDHAHDTTTFYAIESESQPVAAGPVSRQSSLSNAS